MDHIAEPRHHHDRHGHNVVSGEESEDIFHHETIAAATTDEEEHHNDEDRAYYQWDPSSKDQAKDLYYDKNLDDEDEAYVYKNLRGGVRESVTVRQRQKQQRNENTTRAADATQSKKQQQQQQQLPMLYKPRGTDAVLSCPCCFNIVCMDCQRHAKYPNQFRAIFVMGIAVDWQKVLVYDPIQQVLVPKGAQQADDDTPIHHPVPLLHEENENDDEINETETTSSLAWLEEPIYSPSTAHRTKTHEGEYFAVTCANCETKVAALDMTEEVYHFYGCLEGNE